MNASESSPIGHAISRTNNPFDGTDVVDGDRENKCECCQELVADDEIFRCDGEWLCGPCKDWSEGEEVSSLEIA